MNETKEEYEAYLAQSSQQIAWLRLQRAERAHVERVEHELSI